MPTSRQSPPTDEVMTSVPTSDALRQAEILAMRQLSDNLSMLNRTVEGLSKDVRETRDSVIKLEAQELKTTILGVESRFLAAVKDLRDDHGKRLEDLEGRVQSNTVGLARLRAVFVPIASVASIIGGGILAFFAQMAAQTIGRH